MAQVFFIILSLFLGLQLSSANVIWTLRSSERGSSLTVVKAKWTDALHSMLDVENMPSGPCNLLDPLSECLMDLKQQIKPELYRIRIGDTLQLQTQNGLQWDNYRYEGYLKNALTQIRYKKSDSNKMETISKALLQHKINEGSAQIIHRSIQDGQERTIHINYMGDISRYVTPKPNSKPMTDHKQSDPEYIRSKLPLKKQIELQHKQKEDTMKLLQQTKERRARQRAKYEKESDARHKKLEKRLNHLPETNGKKKLIKAHEKEYGIKSARSEYDDEYYQEWLSDEERLMAILKRMRRHNLATAA